MILHPPYRSSIRPGPRSERHTRYQNDITAAPAARAAPRGGQAPRRPNRRYVGGAAGIVNVGDAVPLAVGVAVEVALDVAVGPGWVVSAGVGK